MQTRVWVLPVEPHRSLQLPHLQGHKNRHAFIYNLAENAPVRQAAKYMRAQFEQYTRIFLPPLGKCKLLAMLHF